MLGFEGILREAFGAFSFLGVWAFDVWGSGVAWCLGLAPQLHISGVKALCCLYVGSLQLMEHRYGGSRPSDVFAAISVTQFRV